jgi:hypothetical protein
MQATPATWQTEIAAENLHCVCFVERDQSLLELDYLQRPHYKKNKSSILPMSDLSKKGYLMRFEEDRLADPDLQLPYLTCSDFLNNYHQYQPRTIDHYLDTVTTEQLENLENCLAGYYQGDERSVQELLLLYTLLYEMQTGSRQIPIDAHLNWLHVILRSVSLEKQKRAGLIINYVTNLEPVNFQITYAEEA